MGFQELRLRKICLAMWSFGWNTTQRNGYFTGCRYILKQSEAWWMVGGGWCMAGMEVVFGEGLSQGNAPHQSAWLKLLAGAKQTHTQPRPALKGTHTIKTTAAPMQQKEILIHSNTHLVVVVDTRHNVKQYFKKDGCLFDHGDWPLKYIPKRNTTMVEPSITTSPNNTTGLLWFYWHLFTRLKYIAYFAIGKNILIYA